MKKFISIPVWLISLQLLAQTQIFKDHLFEEGGYTLFGMRLRLPHAFGLADSLGYFYTDDTKVLNQIREDWVYKSKTPFFKGCSDYDLFLLKGNRQIERFTLGLLCDELITKDSAFFFETSKLRKFAGQFKQAREELRKFSSLPEARSYRLAIQEDKILLWTDDPKWIKFEGHFTFVYTWKHTGKSRNELTDLLQRITGEIKKNYPGEIFELSCDEWIEHQLPRCLNPYEWIIDVKCNKSLADKFDLYPLGWRQWVNYPLELKSYWK